MELNRTGNLRSRLITPPPAYAITKDKRSIPTPENHARRMEIYQHACASCHGPNSAGGEGKPLTSCAINAPAFLALISDQALRRLIITGRPDLGMPAYAEKRGRPADYRPLTSADLTTWSRYSPSGGRPAPSILLNSIESPLHFQTRTNKWTSPRNMQAPIMFRASPPHVPAPAVGHPWYDRSGLFERPGGWILFGLRKRSVFWVDLGAVTEFPLNQTRRVNFDNPFGSRGMALPRSPACTCGTKARTTRMQINFVCCPSTARSIDCPVSWFPQSGLFMCPCHGGVYYADGERVSGPPPRGLFHCEWRIQDGKLQIQAPHYPRYKTLTASATGCREGTAHV